MATFRSLLDGSNTIFELRKAVNDLIEELEKGTSLTADPNHVPLGDANGLIDINWIIDANNDVNIPADVIANSFEGDGSNLTGDAANFRARATTIGDVGGVSKANGGTFDDEVTFANGIVIQNSGLFLFGPDQDDHLLHQITDDDDIAVQRYQDRNSNLLGQFVWTGLNGTGAGQLHIDVGGTTLQEWLDTGKVVFNGDVQIDVGDLTVSNEVSATTATADDVTVNNEVSATTATVDDVSATNTFTTPEFKHETVNQSSDFAAEAYHFYAIDSSSNQITVQLPSSPAQFERSFFFITTPDGSFNKITFDRNGNTIEDLAEDLEVTDASIRSFIFDFDGSTWRVYQ